MQFLKKLFNIATRATTFYYIEGTKLMNFLLKKKWFNTIMLNRFTLSAALILFIEGFQYYWEFGSSERKNFYFIGFFLWILLSHIAYLYRITRTTSFGSVVSLIFLILYFAYSVYNEVDISIEETQMEEVWAKEDSIQYAYEFDQRHQEVLTLLKEKGLDPAEDSLSHKFMHIYEKEYDFLFPYENNDSFWGWLQPVLIIFGLFVLAIIGHSKWFD